MSGRVVWVTGLGAVTGAGVGAAPLLDALRAGRSCVRPLPELDGLPAARAPDPPRDRRARHLERGAALFLAAAQEAWRDAGLGDEGAAVSDPARYGVIEGSSLGPLGDALETLRARLATGDGAPRATGLVRFLEVLFDAAERGDASAEGSGASLDEFREPTGEPAAAEPPAAPKDPMSIQKLLKRFGIK